MQHPLPLGERDHAQHGGEGLSATRLPADDPLHHAAHGPPPPTGEDFKAAAFTVPKDLVDLVLFVTIDPPPAVEAIRLESDAYF